MSARRVRSSRLNDLLIGWEIDVKDGRRAVVVESKEMLAIVRELIALRERGASIIDECWAVVS